MSRTEFLKARAKLNKAIIIHGTIDLPTYEKERAALYAKYGKEDPKR